MMAAMDQAHGRELATLWRLIAWGRERRVPAEGYWWENRGRGDGPVVLQATIAGSMILREGREVREVPPGHAALFAYEEDSAYGMARGSASAYVCEWVTLDGSGLKEHWVALRARSGSVVAVDDDLRGAMRRLCEQADPRRSGDPIARAAVVQAFVLGLFTTLRRDRQAAQSPVERALDDLLGDPIGAPPLKRLAERHGCSREHLARTFAERMGVPPATWLSRQRLDRAITLLRDTGLPVAAIAAQCGFGSTHTLARQLRAATGKGPLALRRR
jgi:AraC-like DNA-binding protein